jgi:hypothetical protein
MNIGKVREKVRTIIGDNQQTRYVFTDAELDEHILHAVEIFSRYLPVEVTIELETTGGEGVLNLPEDTRYTTVKRVEFPVGCVPPSYPGFSLDGNTLTLHTRDVYDGQVAKVHLLTNHEISEAGSTISPAYAGLLATGAAALATFEEAFKSTNRVNTGGSHVSGRYLEWAKVNFNRFCETLKGLARPKNIEVTSLRTL